MPVAVVVSSDPFPSGSFLTIDAEPDFSASCAAAGPGPVFESAGVRGAQEKAQGGGGHIARAVIAGVTEAVIKDQAPVNPVTAPPEVEAIARRTTRPQALAALSSTKVKKTVVR
jgi:poly(3-hydroxybutyrate) depolymerase